jgi:hypothetical protein
MEYCVDSGTRIQKSRAGTRLFLELTCEVKIQGGLLPGGSVRHTLSAFFSIVLESAHHFHPRRFLPFPDLIIHVLNFPFTLPFAPTPLLTAKMGSDDNYPSSKYISPVCTLQDFMRGLNFAAFRLIYYQLNPATQPKLNFIRQHWIVLVNTLYPDLTDSRTGRVTENRLGQELKFQAFRVPEDGLDVSKQLKALRMRNELRRGQEVGTNTTAQNGVAEKTTQIVGDMLKKSADLKVKSNGRGSPPARGDHEKAATMENEEQSAVDRFYDAIERLGDAHAEAEEVETEDSEVDRLKPIRGGDWSDPTILPRAELEGAVADLIRSVQREVQGTRFIPGELTTAW